MSLVVQRIEYWAVPFSLIFARVSAMAATLPIIGYTIVNTRLRIMISLLLTLITLTVLTPPELNFNSVYAYIFALVREITIGLIIGFGTRFIFDAFSMAGTLVGYQAGLAIANVFDPTSENQLPIIGQFWFYVILLFLFAENFHHILIATIVNNFRLIPLAGGHILAPPVGRVFAEAGTWIFRTALQFALPGMIILLAVDTASALAVRVMPQFNIFFVLLPLKIGLSLFIMAFTLNLFQNLFGQLLDRVNGILTVFLHSMGT